MKTYKQAPYFDDYDEKNIVKGSTIKTEGGFRLGDDAG
jgi:hypothetical protein